MSDHEFVACFCPNCGYTLNESELDNDHGMTSTPNRGSLYTCGWCKKRTMDWNHVIECRRTWRAKQALKHQAAAQDLLQMLDEMDAEYGPPDPAEVAEIEAVFDRAWGS